MVTADVALPSSSTPTTYAVAATTSDASAARTPSPRPAWRPAAGSGRPAGRAGSAACPACASPAIASPGRDRDRDRQEQRQHDRQRGQREQRAVGQHRGQERRPVPGPRPDVGDREQHRDQGRQRVDAARSSPRSGGCSDQLGAARPRTRTLVPARSLAPNRSPAADVASSTTSSRRAPLGAELVTRTPRRPARALSAAASGPRTSSRRSSYDSTARRAARAPASTSGVRTTVRPVGRLQPSSSSCSTSRPRSRTPTRVHICSTSASRWLDRKTVVPAALSVEQQLADLADALRVEPVGRLVEHQQPRRRSSARGQAEPLPHAERVAPRTGRSSTPPSPTCSSASSIRPRRVRARRPAPMASNSARLARPGQVRVRRRPLDQRADLRQHLARPARGIGRPEHLHLARRGQHQAEQHPHRRGLARAVGAEEAVDVALADVEVEAVDGGDRRRTAWSGPSVRITRVAHRPYHVTVPR